MEKYLHSNLNSPERLLEPCEPKRQSSESGNQVLVLRDPQPFPTAPWARHEGNPYNILAKPWRWAQRASDLLFYEGLTFCSNATG